MGVCSADLIDQPPSPSLLLLCCPAFSLALSNLLYLLGWTWSLRPQHFTGILKITFHTSKGFPQQWKSENKQAKIKRFLVLLCRLLPESRTHIYYRSPDIKHSRFRAGLSSANVPIKKILHRGALLLAFWLIPEVAKVTTKTNITVSYSIKTQTHIFRLIFIFVQECFACMHVCAPCA